MEENKWHQIITSFPDSHVLQTWKWGLIKSQYGWEPIYKVWGDIVKPEAAALILKRVLRIAGFTTPLCILYLPKGPLLSDWGDQELIQQIFGDLKVFAQENKAVFIKIDPDVRLGTGIPGKELTQEEPKGHEVTKILNLNGWRYSDEQIQFRNTLSIDLTPSEDELLASMKQKTRYNIRLAGRKGVQVRYGTTDDIDLLYRMYVDTSVRDGFVIRNESYYQLMWETFMRSDLVDNEHPNIPICEPIIAEVDGLPVAAVVIFRFAGIAYYLHGMSLQVHKNKMPNYLLQWKAMIRSKEMGCKRYDLWGAPEVFNETDPMWGVFRFKQGLGGEVIRSIGAYDLPVWNMVYRLYTRIIPRVLHFMRVIGFKRTQQLRDANLS
jgi:lipid II:glycine glycyltransferase (peptidoglycan interpeptide bridge formation enzyme)